MEGLGQWSIGQSTVSDGVVDAGPKSRPRWRVLSPGDTVDAYTLIHRFPQPCDRDHGSILKKLKNEKKWVDEEWAPHLELIQQDIKQNLLAGMGYMVGKVFSRRITMHSVNEYTMFQKGFWQPLKDYTAEHGDPKHNGSPPLVA